MDELRFDGRSVIVTGAGRGIGRSHALELASRGASVVVADLGSNLDGTGESTEPADEVVAEIAAAGGTAVAAYGSITDVAVAKSIVDTAVEAFGRIDIVVNNAGIAEPDWFEDLSHERFARMVEVHYLGTVNVTAAAWPHMMEAGYGRIVNTCSEAAFGIVPKATAYAGGKGGVFGLTRSLANEGTRHGILVNAVTPRANTRLSAPSVLAHTYDVSEDLFGETMAVFRPELVTPAAVYLAHESCAFNGEFLVSGGGQVFRIATVANEGITSEDLTAEDVAAGLDALRSLDGAQEVVAGTLTGDH